MQEIARRRWPALVLSLVSLLPALAWAQQVSTYTVVANWPQNDGSGAPDYRRADVTGVGVDTSGRVFVCAGTRHPVLVFNESGQYLYSFGEGLLVEPHTVRIDPEGNVWITDFEVHQVFKFAPDGTLLQTFGMRNKRGRDATHFNGPTDVAFAPNGNVYISDGYGNSRIVRLSHDGTYLGDFGNWGKKNGLFRIPHSVAVDAAGRVYVADRTNKRIQVFTGEGVFLSAWKLKDKPNSLFIAADQRLFVANWKTNSISVLDLTGRELQKWGRSGRTPGRLNEPHMLTLNQAGDVFVAEAGSKRVQEFAPQ
jgi:DNA-binding beta-propeller fold protein YncE